MAIPSWLQINTISGRPGVHSVTITADPNSTQFERQAQLTLRGVGDYSYISQAINIQQTGAATEKVIHYTSTDGNIVTPYGSINVISNTYTPGEGGKIMYSGNINTMPYRAFYNCTTLSSIEIPEETTVIGQQAFYRCSSLTAVTFHDNITGYDAWAFSDCNLRIVDSSFLESARYIGSNAFDNTRFKDGITLGSVCTFFGEHNINRNSYFDEDNFHKIVCKALIPPAYEDYSFRIYGGDIQNITFWTPCGCDYSEWWDDTFTVFGPGYCIRAGAHKDEFAFKNYHVWFDKTDADYWYLKICCEGNSIPLNVTLYWHDFDRSAGEISIDTWTIPAGEGINSVTTNLSVQDFDGGYSNIKLMELDIEGDSGEYSLDGNHYYLDEDWSYDSIGDALDAAGNDWSLTEIDRFGDRMIEENQIP